MPDKVVSGSGRVPPSEFMANSYTMNVAGIGLVHLNRSRRARRVIISVSPSTGVRVSVPRRTSFQKALGFVGIKKRGFKSTWL